jgi:hypothetical protein
VRAATLKAEQTGQKLSDVLRQDAMLWDALSRQLGHASGLDARAFFSDPANYRGIAVERARAIADHHDAAMQRLSRGLAR